MASAEENREDEKVGEKGERPETKARAPETLKSLAKRLMELAQEEVTGARERASEMVDRAGGAINQEANRLAREFIRSVEDSFGKYGDGLGRAIIGLNATAPEKSIGELLAEKRAAEGETEGEEEETEPTDGSELDTVLEGGLEGIAGTLESKTSSELMELLRSMKEREETDFKGAKERNDALRGAAHKLIGEAQAMQPDFRTDDPGLPHRRTSDEFEG